MVERITVSSNAEAARLASQEEGTAAIAGDMAASLYGLEIRHANIEDRPDNTTRFLIVGTEEVPVSGEDKTSILVSMRNNPGALYGLLEPFQRHGIDLTRIETRPSPNETWAYVFYIDFRGHRDEKAIQAVLGEVEAQCVEMKHLGSYPMGCCDMSCDYEALAARGVQGLSPYQPGKPIEEVAREIGLDPANIIKLASNENPLGPSEKALAAIREALPEITRYPDGNAFHLKQKLAERLGVSSDCLTLGNGSNDVLEIVARALRSRAPRWSTPNTPSPSIPS